MLDQIVPQGSQYLFSQGVLGVVCIGLVWFIIQQRNEIREMREAHKIEVAAERKLNADLQERRVEDYKGLVEVTSAVKVGLDGVLTSIRAIAS